MDTFNVTPFGKELRKLRIDRGLLLSQMAADLEVSSAFLSAVETGRKPIPPSLADEVCQLFQLDPDEAARIRRAADASMRSVTLKPVSPEQSTLVMALARRLHEMGASELEDLRRKIDRGAK
jgi:transcriptional regulator with XRE-family HTH domain